MVKKPPDRLLRTGMLGSVVTILCCFTPVLTFALGIVGLGAVTGYLDYILFPAMALFAGMTFHAIRRRRPAGCGLCVTEDPVKGEGKGK